MVQWSALVTISWRPLSLWPSGRARTPEGERIDANFARRDGATLATVRTPVTRTLRELERELGMIDARDVVLQLDVATEHEFRRDGNGPRIDARVLSPAAVLSFTRNRAPHVFAADLFSRWEDNLRGIVLGLDGLRRLERYGIVSSGEQYRGWMALPATTSPALSTEAAAEVISRRTEGYSARTIMADRHIAQRALRTAMARAHPDATLGSTRDFQLVQEAKRILEAHHGGSL